MFPFGFPGGAVPGNYYPVGPSRPTPPPNAISFPSSGPPPLGMPPAMGQPHGIMNMGTIPPPIPFHMGGGGGFAVPTTPYIAPTRLNVPHNNPPMVMPMPMPMPMPMAMPMPMPQPPSFVPPLPGSPPSDVPPPPPPPPTPPPPSPPTESCPPPPKMPGDSEMMRNIEKLAAFVVTNGPQFESMVRAKQFGDPKFAFLFETDLSTEAGIGHEYYKWKKMSLELQKQAENRDSKPGEERSLSKQSQQVVHSSFDPGEASPTASDIDMEDDFASPSPSRESSEPSVDSGEAVAAEEEINSKQHGDDISDKENEHVSRVSMSPVGAPNRETSPDISRGEEKLGTLLSVAEKGQELQEGSGLARRKSSPHTDLDPLAKEGGEFAMESVSSEDEQAEEQRVKEGRDSTLAQEEDAEKKSTGDETSSSPSQQSPPFTLSESPAPSPSPSKQSPALEYHHENQSRLLLGEESQPRLPGVLPSFNPNVGSGGPSFSADTSKQFTFPNFSQNGGVPSSRQPGLGFSMDHPSSSSSSLSRPWMAPNTWAQTGVVQPSSFSYSGGMEFPPRHMSDGVSLATGKPYDPLSDSLEPEPEPEPGPWRNVMANDSNFHQGDVSTPENDGARLLAKVLQSISPPVDAPSIWRPLVSVAETTTHFGSRKMELGITIPVEKGSSQGEKKSFREPKEAKAKAKKSKEARGLKLLRAAAADRVKELLKPAWKQGQIGKEAFKTITKKSVDKVTGTLKSHQIPKTQEKVAQYLASSKEKIGKLVQSYVDKYTKR